MKLIFKIIFMGICLGIVLLVLRVFLPVDTGTFMRVYWTSAFFFLAGVLLVSFFYNLSYKRRSQRAAKLLENGNPQAYIRETEKLLKTAKGRNLRNGLTLNLAAGYMATDQFDTAIGILESLPCDDLFDPAAKAVWRINLCMSYFETNQNEKAIALYEDSQKFLKRFRRVKLYGGSIAALDILAAMERGQYERADELLQTALAAYNSARLQNAFREIADRLEYARRTKDTV